MSQTQVTFAHGEGCCECNCTNGEIGCGGCLLTMCFPCVAFCMAADESKVNDDAYLHLLMGLGCNSCSLMKLGKKISKTYNVAFYKLLLRLPKIVAHE